MISVSIKYLNEMKNKYYTVNCACQRKVIVYKSDHYKTFINSGEVQPNSNYIVRE